MQRQVWAVEAIRAEPGALLPLQPNASDWDCSLEPEPRSAEGLALRLGLRMVAGLGAEDGKAIAKARQAGNGAPFGSVEEIARRAGVGRPALQALAAADALGGLDLGRRAGLWEAAVIERRAGDDLPLFRSSLGEPPLVSEPAVALPTETEREAVVEDYRAAGLTLRSHPLALLRPGLDKLGLHDTRLLGEMRQGSWIRLPGLVLMRQRPGTAKGVVFVTLEDEHGHANIIIYAQVGERDRAALLSARLLVVEGRVERQTEHVEVPITHVIARRLIDRSDLLDRLHAAGSDGDGRALGWSRDFR